MSAHRLCALADLVAGEARRIDAEGQRIAVVRLGDEVYAIGDRCSHANYSLSEGVVDETEKTLECWKHGSCFSLVTGEPGTLPATRAVPVYDVSVIEDDVIVELGEPKGKVKR